MKIKGYFGRMGAAYVKTGLICKRLNIDRTIEFLVDTGATRTTITDTDVIKLGIDYGKLQRLDRGMLGIGGEVDTYILRDAKLIFETEERIHTEKIAQILVTRHRFRDRRLKERIKWIPSLLGRDILDKYTLLIDRRRNRLLITDEKIRTC